MTSFEILGAAACPHAKLSVIPRGTLVEDMLSYGLFVEVSRPVDRNKQKGLSEYEQLSKKQVYGTNKTKIKIELLRKW